jgi:hypothetical protein
MKTQALAALLTLLPGVAAAQVRVSVGIPAVQVSVNGPEGEPPGPGYVWESARWVNQNGRWVYQQGYWRQAEPPPPAYDPGYPTQAYPTDVVYTEVPPPPPVVEVRPALPYYGAIWVPGYWNWHHRRHHWVRGRWERPRHGYVYEAARWERQGNRWACRTGGWRRHDGDRDRGRYGRYDRNDRHDRHDRRDRYDRARGHGNGRWYR